MKCCFASILNDIAELLEAIDAKEALASIGDGVRGSPKDTARNDQPEDEARETRIFFLHKY